MHSSILSQAIFFHQQGQLHQARQLYLTLLDQNPSAQIHYLLGLLNCQTRQFISAIVHLEKSTASNTNNPDWFNAMAICYQELGKFRCAKKLISRAKKLSPDNPNYTNRYATILLDSGDAKQCAVVINEYLSNHASFHPAYITLANSLSAQKKPFAATRVLLKALRQFPNQTEIIFNLAESLITIGRYTFAKKLLLLLIDNNKTPAESLSQLAVIERDMGNYSSALTLLRKATQLTPENAVIRWNLSLLLLLTGQYAEGWALYDQGIAANQRKKPRFKIRWWQGESLQNKTLLVINEQGLGDQIMLASHLDLVVSVAHNVVLLGDRRLVNILRTSFPTVDVIPDETLSVEKERQCDYMILAGSLYPIYSRQNLALSPRADFLKSERPANTLSKKSDDRLKIGFAWKGGTTLKDQRKRCITLPHWESILTTPDIEFFSLQHNPSESEISFLQSRNQIRIDPIIRQNKDFDYLAWQISQMDLIITVDNTIAHLSAAQGVTTWCLVPHSPDWRWGVKDNSNLWYSSLRLYRKNNPNDWSGTLKLVKEDLLKWLSDRQADVED